MYHLQDEVRVKLEFALLYTDGLNDKILFPKLGSKLWSVKQYIIYKYILRHIPFSYLDVVQDFRW